MGTRTFSVSPPYMYGMIPFMRIPQQIIRQYDGDPVPEFYRARDETPPGLPAETSESIKDSSMPLRSSFLHKIIHIQLSGLYNRNSEIQK